MRPILLAAVLGGFAASSAVADTSSGLSSPEQDFISVVEQYKAAWDHANDIGRDGMTAKRDAALCVAEFKAPVEWVGTIKRIGLYLGEQPPASLEIAVADNITLRTEGDLEQNGSKIARSSSVFVALADMQEGQRVVFSGHFVPGSPCLDETSFMGWNSMDNPSFEFVFTAVAAAPADPGMNGA